MANPRNDIRDAMATLAYNFLKSFGVTLQYTHRNDPAVTVVADIGPEGFTGGTTFDISEAENTRLFFIPIQTSFPPTNGLSIGDKIVHPVGAAYSFFVESYEADPLGAVYVIKATRKQADEFGVNVG